jgi:hypothetical protein
VIGLHLPYLGLHSSNTQQLAFLQFVVSFFYASIRSFHEADEAEAEAEYGSDDESQGVQVGS